MTHFLAIILDIPDIPSPRLATAGLTLDANHLRLPEAATNPQRDHQLGDCKLKYRAFRIEQ